MVSKQRTPEQQKMIDDFLNRNPQNRLPSDPRIAAATVINKPVEPEKVTVQKEEVKPVANTEKVQAEPVVEKPVLQDLTVPAISGKMGNIEYILTTMRAEDVSQRLMYADEVAKAANPNMQPEDEYQRKLDKGRVKKFLLPYLQTPDHFYGPIVACIDKEGYVYQQGMLTLKGDAKLPVADGQHRKNSYDQALSDAFAELEDEPELKKQMVDKQQTLKDEQVGICFVTNLDVARKQQLFSDLNRHAKPASKAIGILFDHRDVDAYVAQALAKHGLLRGRVNLKTNSIGKTSQQVITLSVLFEMVRSFIMVNAAKKGDMTLKMAYREMDKADIAKTVEGYFDRIIIPTLPASDLVFDSTKKTAPKDAREKYIAYSSLGFQAIGAAVAEALDYHVDEQLIIDRLRAVNWAIKADMWKSCLDANGKVTNRSGQRDAAKQALKDVLSPQPEEEEEPEDEQESA